MPWAAWAGGALLVNEARRLAGDLRESFDLLIHWNLSVHAYAHILRDDHDRLRTTVPAVETVEAGFGRLIVSGVTVCIASFIAEICRSLADLG